MRSLRPGKIITYTCAFIAGLSLACVAVMLTRQAQGLEAPTHRLLMLASTGFVVVAMVGGGLRSVYGRLILAGLVLCWLGDYLGPSHFVPSLVSFAVAHICFGIAFATRGVSRGRLLVTLAVMAIAGVSLGGWLLPHVESPLVPAIVGYMVLISAMVGLAAGVESGRGRTTVLIAAALFYISDIFVARWKFVVVDDASNAYYCYPLYYSACLLLAATILLYRPDDLVDAE